MTGLRGYGDHNRRSRSHSRRLFQKSRAGLKDYALGGEEAVLFLEKVSQAIEQGG
ncbi:MAG: hypothetical protein MZV70_60400 [Desulfobacterales bacterium]|nr:hypothetical protein [Desulfobacterales bacterium]